MLSFLALLPRALTTFLYAVAALLRFYGNTDPNPSHSSPSPSSRVASWRSVWVQRLSWLISALSGTLDIEAETKRLKRENEKLDAMIWQTKSERTQIERDNERLAELESKIDALFSKYGINSPPAKKPKEH